MEAINFPILIRMQMYPPTRCWPTSWPNRPSSNAAAKKIGLNRP